MRWTVCGMGSRERQGSCVELIVEFCFIKRLKEQSECDDVNESLYAVATFSSVAKMWNWIFCPSFQGCHLEIFWFKVKTWLFYLFDTGLTPALNCLIFSLSWFFPWFEEFSSHGGKRTTQVTISAWWPNMSRGVLRGSYHSTWRVLIFLVPTVGCLIVKEIVSYTVQLAYCSSKQR